MGGMSAQIPIKDDRQANDAAMSKVRADKLREVKAGHDGTWVAHPALIKIAMDIFDEHMKGPNQVSFTAFGSKSKLTRHQYYVRREEVSVVEKQLIDPKVPGKITELGVKNNIMA